MFGLRKKKVIEDEEEKDQLDIYKLTEIQVQANYIATLVKTLYSNIASDQGIKDEDKEMVFKGAIDVLCSILRQ